MTAKPLKIRLFVEGVEWPVVSATITILPDNPATASIQVVPAESALEIKPRSLVLLFFYDFYEGRSPTFGFANVDAYKFKPPELEHYKILFSGEVLGIGYQKNAMGRNMVLECMDLSNYWDSCWYFKGGGLMDMTGGMGKWADAGGKVLYDIFKTTGEKVYDTLNKPPIGYEVYREGGKVISQLPGLLGGMIRLLQSIGGVQYKKGSVQGVSKFFTLSELRLKLTNQIGVYPDPTPNKLMKRAGFGFIWNKSLKGLGKQFNFRMAINALQRYIFYEVFPNPVAKYSPPTGKYANPDIYPHILRGHPLYKVWTDAALDMAETIVKWRSLMESGGEVDGYALFSSIEEMRKTCVRWAEDAEDKKIKQAKKNFNAAADNLRNARALVGAQGKKGIKVKKVPTKPSPKYNKFYKLMLKAETVLRNILDVPVPGGKKDIASSRPERFYTQLFRPDLWFCAAPRCNVIFPEQYTSLSYTRSFTREITRLLLKVAVAWAGYDPLFANYVYSPLVSGVFFNKKMTNKKKGEILRMVRDLMPHELYTGVIPHQEKAGGLKVYGVKDNVSSLGAYRVGYMQRLANFLFYKYRYGQRGINVSGPFNPYLVAGFPAVVIDRPADLTRIEEMGKSLEKMTDEEYAQSIDLGKIFTGTHYLGQIHRLVHSVSQSGGTTSITMAYARTHKELADPIEVAIEEEPIKSKKLKKEGAIQKHYTAAAYSTPSIGDRGLYGGEILEVTEIFRPNPAGPFPLIGATEAYKKKKGFTTKVRVHESRPAKEFGEMAVAIAGDPNVSISFKEYEITEEIAKEDISSGPLKVPFEAMVRPAWYGNIWLNEQIGAVYQEFLGIGSITDPIIISDGSYVAPQESSLEATALEASMQEEDEGTRLGFFSLKEGASIKEAIDFISIAYGYAKSKGLDVDEFIRAYQWRPAATIVDLMGSRDLEYGEDQEILSGYEGFFSRSFGDYKDLFLLLNREEITSILGIERGEGESEDVELSKKLDVRRERYLRSLAYALDILERGLRG